MINRIKLSASAIVLIALLSLTGATLKGDEPLKMSVVQLPINSYRLLAMEMDEAGDIWFGSIHHVIHRYTPTTRAVETIQLPQTTEGYPLWASQCLPANGKIYILGQAYPKLMIYDRRTKKFNETSYPSAKPDVWYGLKHTDGRHLYFFDRGGVGLIKWDSQTDTGRSIPYPYSTPLPSFGRYDARDKAIWCGVWDYTGGQYQPIAIARFDVQSDSFAGIYPFPKNDRDLQPYTNPDTTIFYAWTLKGKIVPFDFKTRRWCKFMDVPEFGKRYAFIGISTLHKGKFYFSLSTYNGGDNLGIDGNQYHFANSILVLDPKKDGLIFLTLNKPGKYYQIAYMLSANGEFYATGSNVLTPEGAIIRENKGDIIVWQTQPLRKEKRSAKEPDKAPDDDGRDAMKMRGDTLIHMAKRWLLLSAALIWCAIGINGYAQKQAATHATLIEPFTMRDDFQGDSLGQWASYPPVQDIGYDPSLSPTGEWDAQAGRALMRIVQPTRAGELRFGFIKKVGIIASEGARLSFAYRLNTHLTPDDSIEIGLAGTDGCRYLTRVPAHANIWTTIEVPLRDLRDTTGRPLATGTGVEAIYLVSDLPHTDPDVTYRFMIDNVALTAVREARFQMRAPQVVSIYPWRQLISTVGYRAGDAIRIEAAAPVKLARAECALLTPDGHSVVAGQLYDDGTHGDARAGDGVWSSSSVYMLRPGDQRGVWIVNLHGMTADGRSIETSLRFILHRADSGSHPRLLFDRSEREILLARTHQPQMASLWSKFLEKAQTTRAGGDLAYGGKVFERLDRQYLLPTLLGYFGILSQARERISYNAFVAYLTNDAEAFAAAKSAMLDVAQWSSWVPPWFEAHGQHTYYPAGELAIDVAFGYDLLYDRLSARERAQIRRALIERSIIPTYKEYVLDNRAMANTSNWISHTVCGALFAAAAIARDGDELERNEKFETYVGGLLLKLEDHIKASYLPDGSYGEGISYQEFDLETLAPTIVALRRAFGIDYYPRTFVKDSLTFPIYTLARPVTASLDMGDSHPPGGRTIAPPIYQSKDPMLHWYYRQFDHASIIDFIFYDDSVASHPPTLPTSRLFAEKGNAVFRSGWGADDSVLLYRAGPTFNHNHNDQGSFLLSAFGENLISEAGWSDYYKDPYYATYFTQAIGHNTVLVDENPESQTIADTRQFAALDKYPRITDAITSEFYDAVESELSSVYRGKLDRFMRRIVFIKPHYFLIFDDLAAKVAPVRFDWLLHLPDRARIETSPGLALYTGDKGALAVRMLMPTSAELRVRDGHIPYPIFANGTPPVIPPQPAFLDLHTAQARATQFLVALVPARTTSAAQSLAAHMSEVSDGKWVGLRAERGTEHDLTMFRASEVNGEAQYGEWTTDAATWTVTLDGDRIKMLAAQHARGFKRAGRTFFTSERPISLAGDYKADRVDVTASVAGPTKLNLFIGASPGSVQLDGRKLGPESTSYNRANGMISVTVLTGHHQLVIMRR